MAKKFIEFLEAVALIILTAVSVVGVSKYFGMRKELEETPIVDELPGEDDNNSNDNIFDSVEPKVLNVTLKEQFSGIEHVISYEEGMTWVDWLNSEYVISDSYSNYYNTLYISINNISCQVYFDKIIGGNWVKTDSYIMPETTYIIDDTITVMFIDILYPNHAPTYSFTIYDCNVAGDFPNSSSDFSEFNGYIYHKNYQLYYDENLTSPVSFNDSVVDCYYYSSKENQNEDSNLFSISVYELHSDVSYLVEYEKGMTWGEWLNSEYALNDFFINCNDELYCYVDGWQCPVLYEGCEVYVDYTIENLETYFVDDGFTITFSDISSAAIYSHILSKRQVVDCSMIIDNISECTNSNGYLAFNGYIVYSDHALTELVLVDDWVLHDFYFSSVSDSGVVLNSFEVTVDGYDNLSFEYEEGMSWDDWINSEYNTEGYSLKYADGPYYIVDSNGDYLCLEDELGSEPVPSESQIGSITYRFHPEYY